MKRRTTLRESRLAHAAVGVTMLALPASAAAIADSPSASPAQGQPSSQSSAQPAIKARLKTRRVSYGRDVIVTGRAPSQDAGQTVTLEYAPARGRGWRQVASTTVRSSGAFRLTAPLWRSGQVKVAGSAPPPASPIVPVALAASGSGASSTAPERVQVAAVIRTRSRSINALGGQLVNVRGRLIPATAGRHVQLQTLHGRRWATVATTRTGRRGGFDLRYRPGGVGSEPLRVRFRGDSVNAGAERHAGRLTVYRQTVASWYEDGGSTACGFHAYYGVANLSLPCGSKVSFEYGGRTVTAVVDDRGPYVGGRTWDLNQNTAGALGMGGVQTVWSSS